MNDTTNTKLSPQEWDELYETDYETWRWLYLDFLYHRENIGHCEICPFNCGRDFNGRKCGQQNCWVRIHTEQ